MFFTKTKKVFRRVLSAMLCVLMVTQGFIQVYGADTQSAESGYQSYEWTQITSEQALRDYVEKAKSDQETGRKFIDNSKNANHKLNDNDINNWFKVIIGYKTSNGTEYFFSGSQMVEDGEEFGAARVLPTYFTDKDGNTQHIGDSVLNSASGLYAPYIKYEGEENGDPRIYLRFAEKDFKDGKSTEKLSSDALVCNLSWYGIAHHACSYSEFKKTSAASPSGHDHGAACNHTLYNEFIIKFSGRAFQAYVCPSGAADRYWSYDDNDYRVEMVSSPSWEKSKFYLYMGVPTASRMVTSSLLVESMTTTYNSTVIADGAMLEIPKGSCVVMDGLCRLNGAILVNGGVLIIKGTLDAPASLSPFADSLSEAAYLWPGSIKVTNGGTLIVLDTGVMCLRGGTSDMFVENGSHVEIGGGALIACKLSITDSVFTIKPGAALIHGARIGEVTSPLSLGKKGIADNKNASLDALITTTIFTKWPQGDLKIYGKSYFNCEGLYFMNPLGMPYFEASDNCVLSVDVRTNYHAKISDMMKKW